jgi:hypothetical protein
MVAKIVYKKKGVLRVQTRAFFGIRKNDIH